MTQTREKEASISNIVAPVELREILAAEILSLSDEQAESVLRRSQCLLQNED